MIKRIFWDIDETLIHTEISPFGEGYNDVKFTLEDDEHYYTIIRPCSHSLIAFSRELVGAENVFILTTSTHDYANEINRIAGWNFDTRQILTREYIRSHAVLGAYGGTYTGRCEFAHRDNVLIDNLPPRQNTSKIELIGLETLNRYFKITDYYGVDFADDPFEEDVREFLLNTHNTTQA